MADTRVKVLMRALKQDEGYCPMLSDVIEGYRDRVLEVVPEEFLVVNEDERDEEVTEYIKESLWTFNPSFLAGQTGIDEAVFEALQPQCEGANEAILSIVEREPGLEEFVQTAVGCDGYGHFLNNWNGGEIELQYRGEWWYVYRIN